MRYNEYEAKYGDCEILTEFFFCAICNSECKHQLKNISIHLKHVHKMSTDQYEEKYGMIPEDWIIGEDDVITEWNIGTGMNDDVESDENVVEKNEENSVEKNDKNSDDGADATETSYSDDGADDTETSSTVSQKLKSSKK